MSDLPIHSSAFRWRRGLNWFPMGLTYACLYMGRYNLTVAKNELGDLMTKADFGIIFGAGTVTYALAFLINGPLTDRIGGKRAMLIGAFGSAVANLVMGFYLTTFSGGAICDTAPHLRLVFSILYAVNMYFQSFGAVAIVKVNAHWFHVRERGGFSGIFGTMISSGIFFAFTVNGFILDIAGAGTGDFSVTKWVFFVPSALLFIMFAVETFLLADRPGLAGHEDFDTGDASSGEDNSHVPVLQIMKRILTHPIILTVALIEFCTGVLRNGVMHWYPFYAKEVLALPNVHVMRHGDLSAWQIVVPIGVIGIVAMITAIWLRGRSRAVFLVVGGLMALVPFTQLGWGGILFVAGVIGGNVAGWVSDLFFQSRRAPTAGLLYITLAVASLAMIFVLGTTTNVIDWSKKSDQPATSQLQEGDKVLSIAGVDGVENWEEIREAVACLPAACDCDTTWDTKECTCSDDPQQTEAGLQPTGPTIPASVMRDGQRVELALSNPKQIMYAGDRRKLPAGPVLPLSPLWLGLIAFLISLCVIGTHGLLSGTATMDFGGRKGAATAVGMIDGFVYLGTAVQSVSLGYLTTEVGWHAWPIFLFPFGIIGFILLRRIWNAVPKGKKAH